MSTKIHTIEFIPGVLENVPEVKALLAPYSSRVAVISDANVAGLYGERLLSVLREAGAEPYLFSFPEGEAHKTRETKVHIEDAMLKKGLGRDTLVIGMGGGVATDMAGFVAATYGRGVPLLMIPTSILAMVDASIGGKNGVDTPYGKNLIGTIYQPKKIVVDISLLTSLPLREVRNGVVEMIKHGLIVDREYFNYLAEHYEKILALDPECLERAIYQSCVIKNQIVQEDERELGKRHLLNLGHTIGHALEQVTQYQIGHGEGVALGLLVEGYLSLLLGHLSLEELKQIRKVLDHYGLPLQIPSGVAKEALRQAMTMDKKSLKSQPRFVVLKGIGEVLDFQGKYCASVEDSILDRALQWMFHDLCRN